MFDFSNAYRIYIPSPTLPGNYCLAFHYHMFGFHIRELQVFRETTGEGEPETIWRKTKEQGNIWLFDQLTVNIESHQKVRQTFSRVYKKPRRKLCAFCLYPILFRTAIKTHLSRLCYQRSEVSNFGRRTKRGPRKISRGPRE